MDTAALISQFYNANKGQSLLFPPNPEEYRGQCVMAMLFYMRDYWRITPPLLPTAASYAKDFAGVTFIANNPSDPNQLPPIGAIIIWNSALAGSGGSGHMAGFMSNNAGAHTFVSCDSNWGGKTLHQVTHNWTSVAGWLVPITPVVAAAADIINQGDEMIANDTQAHQAYQLLRPNGDGNSDEIASTSGKRTWEQFVTDGNAERTTRDAAVAATNQKVGEQETTINQLNATITSLNSADLNDKAQLTAALGQISTYTAQLTTANDQIKDLQKQIANPLSVIQSPLPGVSNSSSTSTNWVVKVIAAIIGKKKS